MRCIGQEGRGNFIVYFFLKQAGPPASAEKTGHQQSKLVFGTGVPLPSASKQLGTSVKPSAKSPAAPRNLMDSSAPRTMRGKEKEVPRKKKPSLLRKVAAIVQGVLAFCWR